MPARTRRTDKAEEAADPEFLALSARQRRAIDWAFERGAAQSSGRKRQKVQRDVAAAGPSSVTIDDGDGGFVDDGGFEGEGGFMEAGGFMDDGGGFVPEEAAGGSEDGGFMPDDGAGGFDVGNAGEGGFLGSSASTPPAQPVTPPEATARIPLRLIPQMLNSLGLPFDDDVLEVFKASASGWEDQVQMHGSGAGESSSRRRKRDEEGGVERKDFRAVCAALMSPDGGDDGGDPDQDEQMSSDDGDAYEDVSDSSLSSISSDEFEFGGGRGKTGVGVGKSKPVAGATASGATSEKRTRRGKQAMQAASGTVKLSSRQKELLKDIWAMLKPEGGGAKGREAYVLGRDEVKRWARELGEMWSDDEMVTLFSSQHEGRGLSYDDFGMVMLRAGLV